MYFLEEVCLILGLLIFLSLMVLYDIVLRNGIVFVMVIIRGNDNEGKRLMDFIYFVFIFGS